MKRLLLGFILMFTLVCALPAFAQPAQEIKVSVDNLPVAFDVKPTLKNNVTLVPFRVLAEALNVQVTWDGASQTISATDKQLSLSLTIGKKTAYSNGQAIILQEPPQIIAGRTLIPLRFFSEALGCKVSWNQVSSSIQIYSPPRAMEVIGFYALGDRETSSWTDLFGQAYPETGQGNTDVVNVLALGWYSLDRAGNLLTRSTTGWQKPDGYEKVLESAADYGIKTQMVIHLTDGDNSLTDLLANQSAMQKAVADIAQEAELYRGVNLDFEGLGNAAQGEQLKRVQESFTSFVQLLSKQLKLTQKELSLTLHAPNSAYLGYDYSQLSKVADQIIVMAYDYGPKPEPVYQVSEAIKKARELVPSEKLILGISVPSETSESILTKVGIAKKYNLQGIALWRLGLVSEDMWNSLRTTVQTSGSKN